MKKNAFTIIEILITMIIMGTLSATLVPRIGGAREKTNETMSKVNQNRQYACEYGIDDLCDSSAGGGASYSDLLPNGWEDITVCDPNNSTKCITMMDRNLGATKAGTTCSSTDTGACGYQFQWGNNHGFNPFDDSVSSNALTNDKINTFSPTLYGPGNYFNQSIFRKITKAPYDWSSPSNDNLWGGSGDIADNNRGYNINTMTVINVEDRRGPCPKGYHIPSRGEWTALMDLWSNSSTNGNMVYDVQFQNYFKLPFAGYRNTTSSYSMHLGIESDIRSSSPITDYGNAWSLMVDNNAAIANSQDFRGNGFPIRCFKN